MFATGEGILTQKDSVTADGLQEVFMTNLFGHFLLVSDCYVGYWIVSKYCQIQEQNHVSLCFLQGEQLFTAVYP